METAARHCRQTERETPKAGAETLPQHPRQKAQQAGHMKAPRYLGLIYLNGEGVAKSAKTAFAYFMQAAEEGDITGQ